MHHSEPSCPLVLVPINWSYTGTSLSPSAWRPSWNDEMLTSGLGPVKRPGAPTSDAALGA